MGPGMFRIIHGLSFPKGDAKVKADITAFKHVPMQSLLKGMPQTSKQVVKEFSDDGKVVQPSLHMAEGEKGKHPLTHWPLGSGHTDHWAVDRFLFPFVAIITEEYPEYTPGLMKYICTIREMSVLRWRIHATT